MTAAWALLPWASAEGGYSAPRTIHASNGGRCSIGMLFGGERGQRGEMIEVRHDAKTVRMMLNTGTYPEPLSTSRSTVVMGATTMNGILWRAANTAALYVPI
jgi:hypothetical protein